MSRQNGIPIGILPLYVQLGDRTYQDGVDIFPDDIYQHITAGGALATTAAVNLSDYVRAFSALSRKYDFVIHICISQEFSCCYQNACLAAAEYENVYVVDSRNLSTGTRACRSRGGPGAQKKAWSLRALSSICTNAPPVWTPALF